MNKELTAPSEEKTSKRRVIHIINPVSGSGRKFRKTQSVISGLGEAIYLTKREGDCADFVAEMLEKDPYTHIVAHGGDGTMSEAVSGIMTAGAGATALFTGVPAGSGNDFLSYMYEDKNLYGSQYPLDLIHANGRYAVNVVNVGFDCTVVSEAAKIRKIPGMGGSFSYIAGVATTFAKKDSFKSTITLEGVLTADGTEREEEKITDEFMLIGMANCRYYGGGFKAFPVADPSDGYIDVLAVRNLRRAEFVGLISDYKKGQHINRETCSLKDKFRKKLYFRRCRRISFGGIREVCYDGEIFPSDTLSAEIVPGAVIYTPPKKAWLI